MLYSFCETFPAALQSLCGLPVSAIYPSGFPWGGWKSLLSLRLHSLLNSLSLYLLQGQKQQKQPGKYCNLQETQYSASLGLMECHRKYLLVTVWQKSMEVLKYSEIGLVKSHQIHCWHRWSFRLLYISHIALCFHCICHGRVSIMLSLLCSLHWAQSFHLIAGNISDDLIFFHLVN